MRHQPESPKSDWFHHRNFGRAPADRRIVHSGDRFASPIEVKRIVSAKRTEGRAAHQAPAYPEREVHHGERNE